MSKLPFSKLVEQKLSCSSPSQGIRKSTKKSSTDELKEHGFELGDILGEGSYCKVRSATYKNEDIAVKVINRANLSQDFLNKFLPREIEVLSKIKHENLIKVFKIFNYTDKVYIFMELAQNDMLTFIRDRGHLPEAESRMYFRQIVGALKYLHGLNIAHRDLKCENIMITEEKEIKIIDLGFCRTTVDKNGRRTLSETYCGSTAYAAPEVLQGTPYNPMMYDVWSLGCVLFIMVTGRMPFDDKNVRKMVTYQLKKRIKFPSAFILTSKVKILIKAMLEPDVTKRVSMERVSQSHWLKMDDTPPDSDKGDETEDEKNEHSQRTTTASIAPQVDISSSKYYNRSKSSHKKNY